MPNIENLKKQAKQYLRWHRQQYYPVAAQIRAALPRFRHMGDVQILESSFRLADAQELVARQMGFDGWQALKSGAHAMTDEPRQTTPRPILSSIEAQLFVANIKSSCDFYTNKLGFAVEFIYGDPPYYGQVVRDNARLNLRLVFEPVFVADVRKREHLLSASITVATANEIKQLGLLQDHWIERFEENETSRGRQAYRITREGRKKLRLEIARMKHLTQLAGLRVVS